MFSPWTNPLVLRGLQFAALGKAALRYRNPRRRRIGREQVAFYERVWREAAEELGGSFTLLKSGIAEITLDGQSTRVCENTCALDDPVTLAVLADKPLTYRILREQNLPVPRHATFSLSDLSPAMALLKQLKETPFSDGPEGRASSTMHTTDAVVKPAAGTGGGRGVTTGIRTPSHLARAAAIASVYGDDLLIEEQISGDNYRLLFLDGELIDSFVRRLPSVIADGKSSVASLIRQMNDDRLRHGVGRSQVLLTVDFDLRRTLAKQGLSLRSVPKQGTEVILKTVVNENGGADNTTATDRLCPSIIEDCAKAARALRVRLTGVDIITPDASVPLQESGGVILEVNAPPNFYYHYHKHDGAFPVAEHVLKRMLCDHLEAVP